MAVTVASTIRSPPGDGSENQQTAEIGLVGENRGWPVAGEKQGRS